MHNEEQLSFFDLQTNLKKCNRCLKIFDINNFFGDRTKRDGHSTICKICYKQYCEENREKMLHRSREYEKNNQEKRIKYRKLNRSKLNAHKKEYKAEHRDEILKKSKIYRDNNKDKRSLAAKEYFQKNKEKIRAKQEENKDVLLKYWKNYRIKHRDRYLKRSKGIRNSIKNSYNLFASKLTVDDGPEKDENGFITVICTYCGRRYYPTRGSLQHRTSALIGQSSGEGRLYCGWRCKAACPVFKKRHVTPGLKHATSREVQPQLRQLVFARDDYKCVKCGVGIEETELHCHHIDPVIMNPIESADKDNCIALCKPHHIEAHRFPWCKTRC